jgi:hypothetical protein
MKDSQHYTTKAYLEQFIHPSNPQRCLYPYTRTFGRQREKGPKNLACSDNFYAHYRDGIKVNQLDEARKAFETMAFASGKYNPSPFAKCVFSDEYIQDEVDKMKLEITAVFLSLSSPVQIHNSAMQMLFADQMCLLNRINTNEAKQIYSEEYGDDGDKKLAEHRQDVINGKLFTDVGEENWKQLGLRIFEMFHIWLEPLGQMNLTVCHAGQKSFFITSDNPMIITSRSQWDSPGMITPDVEVWFPISWKKGLLWTWKNKGIKKRRLAIQKLDLKIGI